MIHAQDVPDLIGIAELAALLGVTKQRASEIAAGAYFPRPAAILASGPVWNKASVARYSMLSRRPGRPTRTETVGQRLRRHLREDCAMHSHSVSEDSQERVYLWVCVPGPQGVTYVLSAAQAEALVERFFDGGEERRASLPQDERARRVAAKDAIDFIRSNNWEERSGFVKASS